MTGNPGSDQSKSATSTSEPRKGTSTKHRIEVDWDWMDYRIHSVIILIILVVMQVAITVINQSYSGLFMQFLILTLSTNIVALVYAIFGYSIYDNARRKAKTKLAEEGVEVMEFDEALNIIASASKLLQAFYKKNQKLIDTASERLGSVDLLEFTKFIESLSQVSRLLSEMGWIAETLEKIKPSLIQIAAVGPKYTDLLPEIAKLLAVLDTDKLKNSLVTMRIMTETNGAPHSPSDKEAGK